MVVPLGGPSMKVPAERHDRYVRHAGAPVILGLRPEDLTNTWTDERQSDAVAPIDLAVEITEPLGADKLIFGRIGETEVIARITATVSPPVGSTMRLNAHLDHMHLFDPATGDAL